MRAALSPIYREKTQFYFFAVSFLELGFSFRLISSRFVSPVVYPLPNARNGGAQNPCKSSLVFNGLFLLMSFFSFFLNGFFPTREQCKLCRVQAGSKDQGYF